MKDYEEENPVSRSKRRRVYRPGFENNPHGSHPNPPSLFFCGSFTALWVISSLWDMVSDSKCLWVSQPEPPQAIHLPNFGGYLISRVNRLNCR